tara:strand:- start:9122 stop:9292 length:171 start_codon:yes stop_codon:yes gene_type:complete
MLPVKKEITVKKRTPLNHYVEKKMKPNVNVSVGVNLRLEPSVNFAEKMSPRDARKS